MATTSKINSRNGRGTTAHNTMTRGNPIRSRQNYINISRSSQRHHKNDKHDRNDDINKRDEIRNENTQKRKKKTAASTSIREQFLRTNLDILLIGIFLAAYNNHHVDAADGGRVEAFASLIGHYWVHPTHGSLHLLPPLPTPPLPPLRRHSLPPRLLHRLYHHLSLPRCHYPIGLHLAPNQRPAHPPHLPSRPYFSRLHHDQCLFVLSGLLAVGYLCVSDGYGRHIFDGLGGHVCVSLWMVF